MMIGESRRHNPTVNVPPWPPADDPSDELYSPYSCSDYTPLYLQEALTALQRYLPSNDTADFDSDDATDAVVDAYSCDHFRIYEFKVRRCARGRSHDWTECPYAHPGEKARRRDPRKYHYSGTACPDFRKGSCKKGDSCEFAHGVFECWLHPARYRTQPCKDGLSCRRKVCFFAHTPEQLRVFSSSSPRSNNLGFLVSSPMISPPSTPTTESSPPMSPMTHSLSRSLGSNSNSINEMVISLRNLQIGNMKYGSPRGSKLRPGFYSLPTTPTMGSSRSGMGYLDLWDETVEEEPAMERVESGRDLRAKMFEKLSKENPLERVNPKEQSGGQPDVDWISKLVE